MLRHSFNRKRRQQQHLPGKRKDWHQNAKIVLVYVFNVSVPVVSRFQESAVLADREVGKDERRCGVAESSLG